MKKIAVLMNTNEVGGAERSLAYQLKDRHEAELIFFIPKISESMNLELFLRKLGFVNIEYYFYPNSVYSVSRKNYISGLNTLKDIVKILIQSRDRVNFHNYDAVYLNGNKAAFLFFLQTKFSNFKGKVIWHLRDYYHSSFITDSIWKFLNKFNSSQLSFVCNSNSVKTNLLTTFWSRYPAEVIYNPVGETFTLREMTKPIKVIGFVSMLAPWKGIHEIVLWSKLYEKDLLALGITQINVYGESIYKTNGDHQNYQKQIEKLCNKFNTTILHFKGHLTPDCIYQEIDCLIHYSLRQEPFGRVILEAFEAGVPVISTCLGGAAELVDGTETGLKVFAHDQNGLYEAIAKLVINKEQTRKQITKGIEKSKNIQKNISFDMRKVLEVGAAL